MAKIWLSIAHDKLWGPASGLTAVDEVLAAELEAEAMGAEPASLTLQILPPLFLYFRDVLPVLLLMMPSGIPLTVASLA